MSADSAQFGYVQRRIAKGEYRVDSMRVAEAMLERIGAIGLDRRINEAGRVRRTEGPARRQV